MEDITKDDELPLPTLAETEALEREIKNAMHLVTACLKLNEVSPSAQVNALFRLGAISALSSGGTREELIGFSKLIIDHIEEQNGR